MELRTYRKPRLACLIAGATLLVTGTVTPAVKPIEHDAFPDRVAELDRQVQVFSARFYAAQAQSSAATRHTSIQALDNAIRQQLTQDNMTQAVASIVTNLPLIKRHIDSKPAIGILAVLLDANEWETASALFKLAQQEADRSVISNMAFSFARHNFQRNRWRETRELLEEISRDLPAEDLHHALLMQGICAQKLHEHRQAIEIYKKIPVTSRHYQAARLNMAIANIRQDWWTDAHIIIDELLQARVQAPDKQQVDRLYTVLGYSFLQRQYYRNSRDAFRHVSLDGPYTNQALLGIALTAANQEDFIGALNAVRVLKKHDTLELPVDEAHLLTAYFYEKLGQYTTASSGYSEAITYFENRINSIKNLALVDGDEFSRQLRGAQTGRLIVNGEVIHLDDILPSAFFSNYRLLLSYQTPMGAIARPGLAEEFRLLKKRHETLLADTVRHQLTRKTGHLASYMNQARFGLARMYDTNATKTGGPP